MGKTKYDRNIEILEKQIARLNKTLSDFQQRKAEALCPHKVGDVITDKKGKRKAKITVISYDGFNGYRIIGHWVLKDGSIGKEAHKLYWFEWD